MQFVFVRGGRWGRRGLDCEGTGLKLRVGGCRGPGLGDGPLCVARGAVSEAGGACGGEGRGDGH